MKPNTLMRLMASGILVGATTRPPVHLIPQFYGQRRNPAKNSIRRAKRRMGARQFRMQLKAYNRAQKALAAQRAAEAAAAANEIIGQDLAETQAVEVSHA